MSKVYFSCAIHLEFSKFKIGTNTLYGVVTQITSIFYKVITR